MNDIHAPYTGSGLRELLSRLDVSMADLADRWGVSKSTVYRLCERDEPLKGVYQDAIAALLSDSMPPLSIEQVVDGELISTEGRDPIAVEDHGSGRRRLIEALYVTEDGQYFLARRGGSETEVAKRSARYSSIGREIEKLTLPQAMAWAEETRSSEAASHFASV